MSLKNLPLLLIISSFILMQSHGLAHDDETSKDSKPAPGAYTPTADYQRLTMHGWPVLVNPALDEHPQLKADTLELLNDHLYRITRKIPQPALDRIREIEIWVELDMHKTACMCYHVSKGWLVPNGYNPDKEGTVEIGNSQAFLDWTQGQPWMVLHELAHGFHDKVYGYEHPGIKAAWQNKVDQGDYERVLHISGGTRKHYGLTNQMEYFAETTEAYFGCNDFHPFVKGELLKVDPKGVELIQSTWFDYRQ
ncbi:MAG: hypothetical protein CMJ39_04980 [Phycisphaerae bacterium]|nr:hypothetical protein [Phycisphaerae bacterium]